MSLQTFQRPHNSNTNSVPIEKSSLRSSFKGKNSNKTTSPFFNNSEPNNSSNGMIRRTTFASNDTDIINTNTQKLPFTDDKTECVFPSPNLDIQTVTQQKIQHNFGDFVENPSLRSSGPDMSPIGFSESNNHDNNSDFILFNPQIDSQSFQPKDLETFVHSVPDFKSLLDDFSEFDKSFINKDTNDDMSRFFYLINLDLNKSIAIFPYKLYTMFQYQQLNYFIRCLKDQVSEYNDRLNKMDVSNYIKKLESLNRYDLVKNYTSYLHNGNLIGIYSNMILELENNAVFNVVEQLEKFSESNSRDKKFKLYRDIERCKNKQKDLLHKYGDIKELGKRFSCLRKNISFNVKEVYGNSALIEYNDGHVESIEGSTKAHCFVAHKYRHRKLIKELDQIGKHIIYSYTDNVVTLNFSNKLRLYDFSVRIKISKSYPYQKFVPDINVRVGDLDEITNKVKSACESVSLLSAEPIMQIFKNIIG